RQREKPYYHSGSQVWRNSGLEFPRMTLLVVITVDLENPQTPLRTGFCKSNLFAPIINGQHLGYLMILRIMRQFRVRGVFFVNVYEAALWGDHALQAVCQQIVNSGNEVGLHTHPEWSYDSARIHMWQYSVGEQTKIVADGLAMLMRWIPGCVVVAHRAGAYGLNKDTLIALRKNSIPIDSSMFYGHPNCRLTWSHNQVVERDGILEIPITGFFREEILELLGIPIRHHISFVKTDIDAASLEELKFFVQEAKKHDIRVMNLFLHSYSFIRFNSDFSHFEPDWQDIEKFERFLEFATSDQSIKFVTMKELYEMYQRDPGILLDGSDYVPVYRYQVNLTDKIKRKLMSRIGKWC
ncbi:MAG: hypothetical protein QXT77_01500, partial [Candidatus Methanomethylicaceae archaeon]